VVYFTEWLGSCMGSRYATWLLLSGELYMLITALCYVLLKFSFNFIQCCQIVAIA
jgi:hypothetical protein